MLFISDSNIFIDAIRCGIAERMLLLRQRICITDYVYTEMRTKSSPPTIATLERLIQAGMQVMDTDLDNMMEILSRTRGLSEEDCSVLECAKRNEGTMITGDKALRNSAKRDGVLVRGMLHVFDEMVGQGILAKEEAAGILQELMAGNARLPTAEIEKRIAEWGA